MNRAELVQAQTKIKNWKMKLAGDHKMTLEFTQTFELFSLLGQCERIVDQNLIMGVE